MYSNVLNVRKPRQKSARWILVDFETEQQAQEFKKILEEKKRVSKLLVHFSLFVLIHGFFLDFHTACKVQRFEYQAAQSNERGKRTTGQDKLVGSTDISVLKAGKVLQ